MTESANKIFKRFRQTRARKSSRVATMKDVYHRMINCSDPLVLHSPINRNLAYAKNRPLSETVKSMLLPFSVANFVTFDEYMKRALKNNEWILRIVMLNEVNE